MRRTRTGISLILCGLVLAGLLSLQGSASAQDLPRTGGTPAGQVPPVAGTDAAAPRDTAALSRIDSLLLRYVDAITKESVESKERECTFLIESATDPELRRRIALKLFDYYKESPLMGDEAVAIFIYDKWFANGTIAMRSEFDKLDADMFAAFNRQTLIGMTAPKLRFRSPCGRARTVPRDGRTSVLYFFDTACGKCKVESRILPDILARADFPLDFCAIYAGQDRKAWKEWRKAFRVQNPNVRVIHLWDPEVKSDFLRTYGVLSTPRLYVVEPSGTVLGRRLEAENLLQLLPLAGTLQKAWNESR